MELANYTILENITSEQCPKESGAEVELSMTAHQQNEVPEALQEVKSPSGGTTVEVVMEKLKAGKNVKEKQSNDLDRLGLKRKSESDEKPAVRKEPRLHEPENPPINVLLSHIPLKTLMEVEMKLVYADEEEVTYEFWGPQLPNGAQPKCPEAIGIDALRTPDGCQPQMDKWLQVALKDASTCYKQKKYAVAAGQFRTALEVGGESGTRGI
ncbi:hypothetical protein lerEdw1_016971 [Lerista edwardsae]|nr:hypothetical protein lerEdw1_016971 [Lerista edwardsae]